ncbi:glycoside hydrolase family 9 protein [Actinoplanes sp. NPDC051851]|uniref:glycoside hydrolase family 9 protein n=1 Tax=Actinoplanes sp. NPDC051851 TaxID=3154753 RepID=UPI0034124529
MLLLTACDTAPPEPPAAQIRLDQVGWAPGERKIATLLTPEDAAGATAMIIDERGRVVLRVAAGASRGAWNARFRATNPIDLSALHASGTFRVRVDDRVAAESPPFRIAPATDLFGPLVAGTVGYFQAHRDGPDQIGTAWRRQPAHLDDRDAAVFQSDVDDPTGDRTDAAGGWYDAGDFLKFTHTTAYALIAMQLVQRDGPAPDGLAAEIAHGLDWLTRMTTGDTFYIQVGIGGDGDEILGDHDAWRLPQDDDELDVEPGDDRYYQRYRPVFRAAAPGDPISPNLAGRVTAAFALAAQLAPSTTEAATLLDTAASIFDRAATEEVGELVTTEPRAFYPEDSWQDDLALGATELALAGRRLGDSRTDGWTTRATEWAAGFRGGTAGLTVYDVQVLADAELYRLAPSEELRADLRKRLDTAVAAAGRDPFGAAAGPGGADYTARQLGWAATASLYRQVSGDTRYAEFGTRSRDVVLGANGWGLSLVIGAGTTYPQCPHDQIGTLTRTRMTGAVVNGPNAADRVAALSRDDRRSMCRAGSYAAFDRADARYADDMLISATNEPSIDFTATGMLALALAARFPDS